MGFEERNGISLKNVCSASTSINEEMANEWFDGLTEMINEYESTEVSNVDETGLFIKCMPNKTLTFNSEKCSARKNSKERVTVLDGVNGDGSEK